MAKKDLEKLIPEKLKKLYTPTPSPIRTIVVPYTPSTPLTPALIPVIDNGLPPPAYGPDEKDEKDYSPSKMTPIPFIPTPPHVSPTPTPPGTNRNSISRGSNSSNNSFVKVNGDEHE